MRFLVAQLGARRHYAVPRELHESGLLEMFITDACAEIPPWSFVTYLPRALHTTNMARIVSRKTGLPRSKICGTPELILSDIFGSTRRKSGENNIVYWIRRNKRFGEAVIRRGFGHADSVYVFNGAGSEILRAAKQMGLFCVVDQTSAPMRWDAALLKEEAERWSDWATPEDSVEGWEEMAKREEEEWRLADRIICGSQYVADTIKAVDGPVQKCRVVPYGYGEEKPEMDKAQKAEDGRRVSSLSPSFRPLHVLFAGTLCLRKGIPYLHEAIKMLDREKFEFRIVGPSAISERGMSLLRQVADVCGAVPSTEMKNHYGWADVLVLPTISEGSANVCREALVMGLDVITTPNAGAIQDAMIHQIQIRNPDAIAEELVALQERTLLTDSRRAMQHESASSSSLGSHFATGLIRAIHDM